MTTFNVDIHVFELIEAGVLHLNVNPETVPLNGREGDTILWTIKTPDTATFKDQPTNPDIQFMSVSGKEHFSIQFISSTQILATIAGTNENQTIYTYYLTVHLRNPEVAIRIDPEVDNPPPPPGP